MTSRHTRDVREAGEALATLIELAPQVMEAALKTLSSGSAPTPPAKAGKLVCVSGGLVCVGGWVWVWVWVWVCVGVCVCGCVGGQCVGGCCLVCLISRRVGVCGWVSGCEGLGLGVGIWVCVSGLCGGWVGG